MNERVENEKNETDIPEWSVTYGDMMSLLLCFFVMLYAVSTIQESRFQSASESLRSSFGLFDSGTSAGILPPKNRPLPKHTHDKLGGTILFEAGSGELDAEAKRTLDAIERQMTGMPMTILILAKSGTAESASYRRGIDLAYARGTAVWDYLTALGMNKEQCRLIQQSGENEGAIVEIHIEP